MKDSRMQETPQYPRISAEARFRRPKVLKVPEADGGVVRARFEWDDPVHVDELLEVEIPISAELSCATTARVARVDPIVWKEPTRYEVYLDLFNLGEDEKKAVCALLEVEGRESEGSVSLPSSRYVLSSPATGGSSFRRPRREPAREELKV